MITYRNKLRITSNAFCVDFKNAPKNILFTKDFWEEEKPTFNFAFLIKLKSNHKAVLWRGTEGQGFGACVSQGSLAAHGNPLVNKVDTPLNKGNHPGRPPKKAPIRVLFFSGKGTLTPRVRVLAHRNPLVNLVDTPLNKGNYPGRPPKKAPIKGSSHRDF